MCNMPVFTQSYLYISGQPYVFSGMHLRGVYAYIYVHMSLFTFIGVSTLYLHACMHIHTYIHAYIHTYILHTCLNANLMQTYKSPSIQT